MMSLIDNTRNLIKLIIKYNVDHNEICKHIYDGAISKVNTDKKKHAITKIVSSNNVRILSSTKFIYDYENMLYNIYYILNQ